MFFIYIYPKKDGFESKFLWIDLNKGFTLSNVSIESYRRRACSSHEQKLRDKAFILFLSLYRLDLFLSQASQQ